MDALEEFLKLPVDCTEPLPRECYRILAKILAGGASDLSVLALTRDRVAGALVGPRAGDLPPPHGSPASPAPARSARRLRLPHPSFAVAIL
eukprot:751148-Hanusia_phi.AAC.1